MPRLLFVGNSFTHGHCEPATTYGASHVSDLNALGYGGVPAMVMDMCLAAGLAYDISLEAISGQTLEFHALEKSGLLTRANYDIVVLQELSTRPLPQSHGGEPMKFESGARELTELFRSKNPAVRMLLFQTWSSPTGARDQGYVSGPVGLRAMQADLTSAYARVAKMIKVPEIARVGEAFLTAIDGGVAKARGADARDVVLFADDIRHAGPIGSYLAATVLFAQITGHDPRTLGIPAIPSVAAMNVPLQTAKRFHEIAHRMMTRP